MNKLLFAIFPWLFAAFSYKAMAQDAPSLKNEKKETQEIVIRKNGNKDVNVTVQITGDKVLINGKPLAEFKDDDITINNRTMTIRGYGGMDRLMKDFNFNVDNIRIDGKKQPFLGVTTEPADDGVKIREITKASPAEKAGLLADDLITQINDTKIASPAQLSEVIGSLKAKDEITVTYKRGKKEHKAKATLDERKYSITGDGGDQSRFRAYGYPRTPGVQEWQFNDLVNKIPGVNNGISVFGFNRRKLGLKIQDTEEGNGVKVLEVEDSSAAAIAGLKKDDLITEIGGEKVTNTDEAREQLQANAEKSSYPVKAKRGGSELNFTIKISKKLKTANL
jgi:serine protease Do